MKTTFSYSKKYLRTEIMLGVLVAAVLLIFIIYPTEDSYSYGVAGLLTIYVGYAALHLYDILNFEIILTDDSIVRKGLFERSAQYSEVTSIKFDNPRIYISTEGRLLHFLQVGGVECRDELIRIIVDRMPTSAEVKGCPAYIDEVLGTSEDN